MSRVGWVVSTFNEHGLQAIAARNTCDRSCSLCKHGASPAVELLGSFRLGIGGLS